MRKYIPDFIVQMDDGHEDPLNLIVEIKGYRGEDAKEKKATMDTYWIPGVNHLGTYGRWAFLELKDVYLMQAAVCGQGRRRSSTSMIENVTAQGVSEETQWPNERANPKNPIETIKHEEASRKHIPTAEYPIGLERRAANSDPGGYAAPQPGPGPAVGLARQGYAGLV